MSNMPAHFSEFEASSYRPQPSAAAPGEDALRRLFGQDFDKFVDEHVDAYNEAKKRWSECSIEEWQAGANGESRFYMHIP